MTSPRIYADFNGLSGSSRTPGRLAVALDCFGTLRDLTNAGMQLREGVRIIAYDWSDENEDLEGHAIVYFDPDTRIWFGELDDRGVMYVPAQDRVPDLRFLCLRCRADLAANAPLNPFGRPSVTTCETCGTPVGAALAPPIAADPASQGP